MKTKAPLMINNRSSGNKKDDNTIANVPSINTIVINYGCEREALFSSDTHTVRICVFVGRLDTDMTVYACHNKSLDHVCLLTLQAHY